jgi:hypothetical protein
MRLTTLCLWARNPPKLNQKFDWRKPWVAGYVGPSLPKTKG